MVPASQAPAAEAGQAIRHAGQQKPPAGRGVGFPDQQSSPGRKRGRDPVQDLFLLVVGNVMQNIQQDDTVAAGYRFFPEVPPFHRGRPSERPAGGSGQGAVDFDPSQGQGLSWSGPAGRPVRIVAKFAGCRQQRKENASSATEIDDGSFFREQPFPQDFHVYPVIEQFAPDELPVQDPGIDVPFAHGIEQLAVERRLPGPEADYEGDQPESGRQHYANGKTADHQGETEFLEAEAADLGQAQSGEVAAEQPTSNPELDKDQERSEQRVADLAELDELLAQIKPLMEGASDA